MMREDEIDKILADLVTREVISVEERQLLEKWTHSHDKNLRFEEDLRELACSASKLKHRESKTMVFERVEQIVRKKRKVRLLYKLSVAACIILLVGMMGLRMFFDGEMKYTTSQIEPGIVPGSPHAELILPQGKVILLDTTTKRVPVVNGVGQVICRSNTLIYNSDGAGQQDEYHTIRVPRGGEYNLQLSDNTKVYLNAGSSLRYPVHFQGNKREVFLIGEGYFEVTRDTARPFIVKAGNVDVLVLGTEFNVNAYADEQVIATTLVEGSVQVDYGMGQHVMQPGTHLVYNKNDGRVKVDTVDTEVYTSWKNGYYYFKRESLENIMNVLSRWYDLNVFYDNEKLKHLEFGGRLKRYEDITYLLQRMEETQDVDFIINENTITVKRKTD